MTESSTERPTKAPCWPGDPDWLDGPTEIELPSSRYLRAYWDCDILDTDDKNPHDTIIDHGDVFKVRFRVQLEGRLWWCICGHWCFDVGFDSIGPGQDFNLSGVLPNPSELRLNNWEGCKTRCIYVCVTVPPNTIPAGYCGSLYEVGAKFELRCCGDCDAPDSHLAVAGHEDLGQYMFV
jgi:hypothetical protein